MLFLPKRLAQDYDAYRGGYPFGLQDTEKCVRVSAISLSCWANLELQWLFCSSFHSHRIKKLKDIDTGIWWKPYQPCAFSTLLLSFWQLCVFAFTFLSSSLTPIHILSLLMSEKVNGFPHSGNFFISRWVIHLDLNLQWPQLDDGANLHAIHFSFGVTWQGFRWSVARLILCFYFYILLYTHVAGPKK